MKIKIIEQDPLHLAGVVHYGTLDQEDCSTYAKTLQIKLDDEDFDESIRNIKVNAKKIKEEVMEELKRNKVHMNKDYKEHKKVWKEEAKKRKNEEKDNKQEDGQYMYNFEGAINRFGDVMEAVGRHIEKNARNWEDNLKDWSQNFEVKMEDFGEKMEAWGEDFGKRMEEWGEQFGKEWEEYDSEDRRNTLKRHPIYQTYLDLFDKQLKDHPDLLNPNKYYEVQILDTSYGEVNAMVMLGSKLSTLDNMTYPIATMTFKPDKWVAVKMTKEEYEKDWLGSLEKVEQLNGYDMEPYFMIRRKHNDEGEMIKLFVPLKVINDEG